MNVFNFDERFLCKEMTVSLFLEMTFKTNYNCAKCFSLFSILTCNPCIN